MHGEVVIPDLTWTGSSQFGKFDLFKDFTTIFIFVISLKIILGLGLFLGCQPSDTLRLCQNSLTTP